MTSSAKRKGDSAELEVAKLLEQLTGWRIRRKLGAGRRDDTGDIHGIPDCTIQVRSYTNVAEGIRTGLRDLKAQQANSGDPFAALLVRRRGGHWMAVMDLEQLAALLREATEPITQETP